MTITRTATIGSKVGLHARPAATIARAAAASGHRVTLRLDDRHADAASILSILALRASHGDTVTVEVEGDAATAVADELSDLLGDDLDA